MSLILWVLLNLKKWKQSIRLTKLWQWHYYNSVYFSSELRYLMRNGLRSCRSLFAYQWRVWVRSAPQPGTIYFSQRRRCYLRLLYITRKVLCNWRAATSKCKTRFNLLKRLTYFFPFSTNSPALFERNLIAFSAIQSADDKTSTSKIAHFAISPIRWK